VTTKLPSFLTKPAQRPQTAAERIASTLKASAPGLGGAQPKLKLRRAPHAKSPRQIDIPEPESAWRVVPLSRLAQGGKWRTEAMRSYAGPVLLWFTRGQGRITVNGVTRGFGAHNAIWLPAHTMHGFEVMGQTNGHALFFPQSLALPLPEEPQHLRFRESIVQAELSHLIDNLEREISADLPLRDRALEYHAGLLSVWLERQMIAMEGDIPAELAAQRLSSAYSSLVERDYRKGRSIADFAAELGVTPTHLTRSCHQACARSAHEILADRIFFEARRLLKETVVPVNVIASELGFTSAAYFTRAFQKATGEKPTSFRKSK
jgi:AraC family transcriptional regulator, transcriptional activator of pobA